MVLDIPKRVEDMDKPKEVEQDANLEEEAMNLNWSTGYTDSGNTRPRFSKSKVKCNNGKTNIYIYVIMLGIAIAQPRGLKRMQI
jgi:hypothetical protein